MRKLIIIALIALIPSLGFSKNTMEEEMKNVRVQMVTDQINSKPLSEKQTQLKTGDWIWIGVIVAVGITFGYLSYNTRTPL